MVCVCVLAHMCVCIRKDLASAKSPLKLIFPLGMILTQIQWSKIETKNFNTKSIKNYLSKDLFQ